MRKIYIILFLLIIILAGLSIYLQRHTSIDNILTVQYKNASKTITFDALEKMKHETIHSLKGKNMPAIKLGDIIKLLAKDGIAKAVLKSKDGMSITLDKKDISNAYLMPQEKNNQRYYRLAIPSDEFGQRWLKYINVIVIN